MNIEKVSLSLSDFIFMVHVSLSICTSYQLCCSYFPPFISPSMFSVCIKFTTLSSSQLSLIIMSISTVVLIFHSTFSGPTFPHRLCRFSSFLHFWRNYLVSTGISEVRYRITGWNSFSPGVMSFLEQLVPSSSSEKHLLLRLFGYELLYHTFSRLLLNWVDS